MDGASRWTLEGDLVACYAQNWWFWSLPDRDRDMVRIADLYRPLEEELAEEFIDLYPSHVYNCFDYFS